MGTVLRFPAERVQGKLFATERSEAAAILILPVVRIEREETPDGAPAAPGLDAASSRASGGRRRRPAPRP